jgi:hypothetical protein
MQRTSASLRIGLLASLVALAPACSALVSPDTTRLTNDGGTGSSTDLGIGGDDAWSPPGQDAGRLHDAGMRPNDASVPPNDANAPCPPGQDLCPGGCAVVSSDPNNCGGCGTICTGGATCVSGVCTGGTTPSPLGDPNDCGPSHAMCADLAVCFNNACHCRAPYQNFGGVCIDPQTDPNHCGTNGDCGGLSCSNSQCVAVCPLTTGVHDCNGACVNVRNDPGNCGACGVLCTGSQVCALGACHDATVPANCTTCPCADCGTDACCHWNAFNVQVCVSGITTCG